MTLVIAHADEEICFMVADTLVSHEHFRLKGDIGPVNGEFHSLKIQVLSGTAAVGFAGSFDEAYGAVRTLQAALIENQSLDPVAWLVERNLRAADFLVLLNRGSKQLFHVANGSARQVTNAYIGAQEEYAKFLQLKRPYAGPSIRWLADNGTQVAHQVTFREMEFDVVSDAMEALSRDRVGRKQPSVGAISGCVVRVVDARISKELEYMQSVEVSHFPWEPAGGYSLMAANAPQRGIGIYFRAGGRGFLMPVCGEAACVSSHAPDLASFVQEARDKFGMNLEGGTW